MEREGAEDLHGPCRARIEALEAENKALRERIERLEARLNQNSRNSSRPPSTDPPGAPKNPPKPPSGLSPGGQPGHPGSTRPPVPPDQVSQFVVVKPSRCRG